MDSWAWGRWLGAFVTAQRTGYGRGQLVGEAVLLEPIKRLESHLRWIMKVGAVTGRGGRGGMGVRGMAGVVWRGPRRAST